MSDPYVQAMTAEQYGWYSAMLDMMWIHTPQGCLPNDEQLLSKMVGRCEHLYFHQHAKIVLDRFKVSEDGQWLYHPKMMEQVDHMSQVSEKRRDAGKKGAEKRSETGQQETSKCLANAEQMPTDSDSDSDIDTDNTKKKPSARTAQPDPRFQPFVDLLDKYWKYKNPDVPFTFGATDGKALKNLLKNHPSLSEELFANCLRHRAKSDVVHTESPMAWLPHIMLYAAGPIDRYGKPLGSEPNERKSPARERADRILETDKRVGAAIQSRIAEVAALDPAGIDRGGAVDLGGGVVLLPDRGGR